MITRSHSRTRTRDEVVEDLEHAIDSISMKIANVKIVQNAKKKRNKKRVKPAPETQPASEKQDKTWDKDCKYSAEDVLRMPIDNLIQLNSVCLPLQYRDPNSASVKTEDVFDFPKENAELNVTRGDIFTGNIFLRNHDVTDLIESILSENIDSFFTIIRECLRTNNFDVFECRRGTRLWGNIFHLMAANDSPILPYAVRDYANYIPSQDVEQYKKVLSEKLLKLNKSEETPLDIACEFGSVNAINILLENSAYNFNATYAVGKIKCRALKDVLVTKLAFHGLLGCGSNLVTLFRGCSDNDPIWHQRLYAQSMTYSIMRGNHKQFEDLIKHLPTDFDVKRIFVFPEWNPLHHAAGSPDRFFLDKMLQHGLRRVDVEDQLGCHPCIYALSLPHDDILKRIYFLEENLATRDILMLICQLIVRKNKRLVETFMKRFLKRPLNREMYDFEQRNIDYPLRMAYVTRDIDLIEMIMKMYLEGKTPINKDYINEDFTLVLEQLVKDDDDIWEPDAKKALAELVVGRGLDMKMLIAKNKIPKNNLGKYLRDKFVMNQLPKKLVPFDELYQKIQKQKL